MEEKLLKAVDGAREAGERLALATVVRIKGSAYRREGAKMLVTEGGRQVCMISGGCLEGEVGEIARRVIQTGEPSLHAFDLDEDVVWGLGLGCGGSVDVYIEPFDEREAHAAWWRVLRENRAGALATVLGSATGGVPRTARMFIGEAGETLGNLGDAGLERTLTTWAEEKLAQLYPRAETRRFTLDDGEAEVFLDVTTPPLELTLFGAGHDAIPLARYAHDLGFRVSVVDARPAFLTPERFPGATLVRAHPSSFKERVEVGPRSHLVVMNHHLERDTASLGFALSSPAPYIGVLGPRSRFEKMLGALEDAPAADERVHNPIGVDVGAEAPEEVAVSIVAELLAVRGGYEAGFLKDRDGRIHVHA